MRSFLKIGLFLYSFAAINANAQTYFNRVYDYDNSNTFNNAATAGIEFSNGDFLLATTQYYSFSASTKILPGRSEIDGAHAGSRYRTQRIRSATR